MPPKPNELDIILQTLSDIESWGTRFIEVLVLGLSKFRVGGSMLVSRDLIICFI